jgi:hypothetical protein
MQKFITMTILSISACYATPQAFAQSTEERFQDLFKTAGYATAFGAALGASMLAFTPNPASQLRHVAVGASLGFIGGSLFGSYIIFSPLLAREQETGPQLYAANREFAASTWSEAQEQDPARSLAVASPKNTEPLTIALHPVFSQRGIHGLESSIILARF